MLKRTPEDFVVDELPAYEPSGSGSHLFVHFEKRNLTTDEAVKSIARSLGVERREVGVAGLKDKVAITRQWISVPMRDASLAAKVDALALDGIRILARSPHGNKLRTGHLHGNAFTIVVRGIPRACLRDVEASLSRIRREGVPNAFGSQRFGREGDTHEQARAWLTGRARAPGDPRLRRFHFSALQSWIFNLVLDARVADGSWTVPIPGDLLKKEESGGIFVCTDVQVDRERAAAGEVCPTGPIVGDRMRQPEADAQDLEQRIIAPCIEGIDLRRARSLGEGTRRALRLRVTELSHELLEPPGADNGTSSSDEAGRSGECAMRVRFVLPKGAYATTVLSNVFEPVDSSGERDEGREQDRERETTEEE